MKLSKMFMIGAFILCSAAAWIAYATESTVVAVGGDAGTTPGNVMTVTHSGSTPSATTIKVPATINGTLTVTGSVTSSAGGITATAGNIAATAGNLSISSANGKLTIKEGTALTNGWLGQIALTGGSVLYSNGNVTANTRVFLSRATANAMVNICSTNCVGLGVRVIGAETNTINLHLIEAQ